ncbi:3-keto-5-aminohexanoate cleavage protein [Kribbella sancticallisti]|uniref:3-keto-5-aminohexanoate cleavage protein n=1 Tax=Kribbella sancticallisti TaxID=460087 RepID=A0ABN2C6B7_9ACTN
MYYTDDALYPENQEPLIITAAPYGPQWLPGDAADIPVTWDESVQAAVDCYNAGATHLHVHVRNPQTGQLSVDFDHFNYLIGLLKDAVPEMILSVGGSISFAPKGEDKKAEWLGYDTRHMLTELDPAPDQVTIAVGTAMMDVIQMMSRDDIEGTHLMDPKVQEAWAGLWADAGPAFYIEHLKRLREHDIQPYFMLGHVHQLEIVERLIRHGAYMGPLNHCLVSIGGGASGRNPFDWMEYLRRSPQGSVLTWENIMRGVIPMTAMAVILGINVRVGNEDNIWRVKGERFTTVQQVEQMVRLSEAYGRRIATAKEARDIMKIGTWYDTPEETLFKLGLPPNREEGEAGFLTWETSGRRALAQEASDSHPMAYCLVPPQG